ncbi:MAG: tellurite resistance TerB family protein [Nannocystales bacterium]
MADQTEPGAPVFSTEGAGEREELRVALHESAVAMQVDRVALAQGEIEESRHKLSDRIRELGFEGEAERVFDLLPLVHVAWADGKVQQGERAMILNLLRVRGVNGGSAFTVLQALLEKRPSKEYLDESLEVLRDLLREKPSGAKTVVGLCILVAEAAGGFLQIFNPISEDERAMIEKISKALGDEAFAEYASRLGGK